MPDAVGKFGAKQSKEKKNFAMRHFKTRWLRLIFNALLLLCLSLNLAACESILRVIFNDGHGLRSKNEYLRFATAKHKLSDQIE